MAFTVRDLSVLAYANGFTQWHYKANNDSLAEVISDAYFAEANDMLATGDMIVISGKFGGTIRFVDTIDTSVLRTTPMA